MNTGYYTKDGIDIGTLFQPYAVDVSNADATGIQLLDNRDINKIFKPYLAGYVIVVLL